MSPNKLVTWSKGMTPISETYLDDSASSSRDDYIDADALNEELVGPKVHHSSFDDDQLM